MTGSHFASRWVFEVSWEVCNKVGGIHTVVSTKAPTFVRRYEERYVAIGPWLLGSNERASAFHPTPGFEAFEEACHQSGIPVRVGRWETPGRPRTILVAFSRLFERKDAVLAGLWEDYHVDSLFGSWDYVEPVLFGHAAALVIERWWRMFAAHEAIGAVALFHEWMTGSGALYLKKHVPAIGSVFTTHATMLGRSIASLGRDPLLSLDGRSPEEAAVQIGIRAKHSMEGVCAREADVFTTVSELTAQEAERFHRRRADPLVPNGVDLDALAEILGDRSRDDAAAELRRFASAFLGQDMQDAALLAISGRYEFHNKGIDITLDALADLERRAGRRVVLFVLVPAGNSGTRADVLARWKGGGAPAGGPLGISTHNLFDPEKDPVVQRCRELGIDNAPRRRTYVVQIPDYLAIGDGLFGLPYEAVLQGMDLTCFPSFYEPWGYTPEESLAVGVPAITTDCAGFGQWAHANGIGPAQGVLLVPRFQRPYAQVREALTDALHAFLAEQPDRDELAETCRRTAARLAWEKLADNYERAFELAHQAAQARVASLPKEFTQPVQRIAVGALQRRPQLYQFQVTMKLPRELTGLEELARNLWWCWHEPARALFAAFSPIGWERSGHNPVRMLQEAHSADVQARRTEPAFHQRLDGALGALREYLQQAPRSFDAGGGLRIDATHPVAYLCAEFGLHESLPTYGGGLGLLAGDHLKSASDLGLPLVAVGLFYRMGYIRQRLSAKLEQIAEDVVHDPAQLPLVLLRDERGDPIHVLLQMPSGRIALQVWTVRVGRVTLYLLDSEVPVNRPEDRRLTHRLYGGDHENRLRQEIVLGRGAVRLLQRLEIEPGVWHLNEGHAAFAPLERVAALVKDGRTFDEARLLVMATTAFTTHTPIPAGHDRFSEELIRRYFSDIDQWAGLPWERFWGLGLGDGDRASFNMTYLACSFAGYVNGVSRLHGEVTRELLRPVWPMLVDDEIPVDSITNGVHLPSWTSPRLAELLGARDRRVRGEDYARAAAGLDERALWELRRVQRRELIERVRERLERSFLARHESPALLARMLGGLEQDAMWIGFARRFVPYKRADLMLRDPARLRRMLAHPEHPARLLVAGKAHPQDAAGQEILHRIATLSRREEFLGLILFFEDYDIELARALVRGVDVWLNTPLRPLEASGTSGMKVAANLGLNLSIADGWWAEGADGSNGWTIGEGSGLPTRELQDETDAEHLYALLEHEVLPLFWQREQDGVPHGWLTRVKHALATIPPRFNTDRMVEEYAQRGYAPLAAAGAQLAADGHALLARVAGEHARIRRGFPELRILAASVTDPRSLAVGGTLAARVEVDLGSLQPQDVRVELVLGFARPTGGMLHPEVKELSALPGSGSRRHYGVEVPLDRAGVFRCGLRVRARDGEPWDRALADLVLWAAAG